MLPNAITLQPVSAQLGLLQPPLHEACSQVKPLLGLGVGWGLRDPSISLGMGGAELGASDKAQAMPRMWVCASEQRSCLQ